MKILNITTPVDGMVCQSCEEQVNKYISNVSGVLKVETNYRKASAKIIFDSSACSYNDIYESLKTTEYSIPKEYKEKKSSKNEIIQIIGILILSIFMLSLSKNSGTFNIEDALNSKVGFFALFIIGIFSSIHCIGMCGGIMMSQSISIENANQKSNLKSPLLYNLGRLISYTILGGIVGGIGSVFSLSTNVQASISLIAGMFMVFMGFNIYGFKMFRTLSLRLPLKKFKNNFNFKSPFLIGLLNGFMPCGPLQTMQLYALATGSVISGATSMFFFALGTIPLMLVFGLMTNLFSKNGSKKLLRFSGIIIIVLGISMANRGLSLIGIDFKPINNSSTANIESVPANSKAIIENGIQKVTLTATSRGYSPKNIYIEKNIPTELIVYGEKITSCNNEIIISSLNIKKKLQKGENKITFTPKDTETIKYSCWMGMIRGSIVVVDSLSSLNESEDADEPTNQYNEYSNIGIKFFGLPLETVPTERLVKKATILEDTQNITITSSYDDFEPSAIIAQSNIPLVLNFNIEQNSTLNGKYTIYDSSLTQTISNFEIINGKANVELPSLTEGTYGIVKDNILLLIIEVYDNYKEIDLEEIRDTYFFDSTSGGASCH